MSRMNFASSGKGQPQTAEKSLPKKSQIDKRDLAERIFKLMKEEARLEAERDGRLGSQK